MKKAYIEAYAASENGDGPTFAMVLLKPEFFGKLKDLAGLCKKHGLSELRVYDSPEMWGPDDIETDLRLTCGELVVTNDSFWFVDQPKHADYHIETRAQSVIDFCQQFESSSEEALYFGENDELKKMVAEEETVRADVGLSP